MYAAVKGGGRLGRRLRQLIRANDYEEAERLMHTLEPAVVPIYRWSQLRYSLLHLMAEGVGWGCESMERKLAIARIIRWLTKERGCEVDALNKRKETPLWMAVSRSQTNHTVVRALINARANTNYVAPVAPAALRYYGKPQSIISLCYDFRMIAHLVDGGCQFSSCSQHTKDTWLLKWVDKRNCLLATVIAFLGVWHKRQPNAMRNVDRHNIRWIAEFVWRRRFILG